MARMTAATTPKGERRRYALVCAAADLLCEGGFQAVSHRAVADRADLPLASTTYYFSSLEELIETAVEHLAIAEVSELRARLHELPRRRRGAEAARDSLIVPPPLSAIGSLPGLWACSEDGAAAPPVLGRG